MPKKQPITIAVPLNCNKHTCGSCHGKWIDDTGTVCTIFNYGLTQCGFVDYKRLPECKAAEIKEK